MCKVVLFLWLIEGKSQRKAYIDAGYSIKNKSDDYIDKSASLLLKNSKVLVRYEELKKMVRLCKGFPTFGECTISTILIKITWLI
ncbi:hypothetical protein CD132_01520 [Staphylococcus microti]|nr:hypothetical protein CD132_01520 [Staphylococcus microti]